MKRLLLSVAILTCAYSTASADNFRFSYGNSGQAITGYTQPNFIGGFNGYGYDTRGNKYRFSYQPSFPAYGYSPAYPTYRAPVLNDYYQMNPGRGYGYKTGPGGY